MPYYTFFLYIITIKICLILIINIAGRYAINFFEKVVKLIGNYFHSNLPDKKDID